ncbi:unnamed protein product [Amoebophrya sp. A120]|nr:unnamed protein product [Amoebophrya sp. A120]|eukprot:GSA120T00025228001.1
MLFKQRRAILSCYCSSSRYNPKQAYNRSHLPALQHTHSASCILCITNLSSLSISILTVPYLQKPVRKRGPRRGVKLVHAAAK